MPGKRETISFVFLKKLKMYLPDLTRASLIKFDLPIPKEQIPSEGEISNRLISTKEEGNFTLSRAGKFIHSKHAPMKEAIRALTNKEFTDDIKTVIVIGAGLGYTIRHILQNSEANVIWVEEDRELLCLALGLFDYKPYQVRIQIRLLAPGVSIQKDFIDSLVQSRSNLDTLIVSNPVLIREGGLLYQVSESIIRAINKKDANRATLTKFQNSWARNLSLNLYWLRESAPVSLLFHSVSSETPVLVCGAGPSLTDLLPEILAIRNKIILVAVDTATSILTGAGIDPDYIVTVDPQAINSYYLQGYVGKAAILIDPSTSPLTSRNMSKSRLYINDSPFPLFKLFQNSIAHPIGHIDSGGSVSTNALDFAEKLGSRLIILAGQDLGFTRGLAHAKGALLEERLNHKETRLFRRESHNQNQLSALPVRKLPSIHGDRDIRTNDKLVLFYRWFCNRVQEASSRRVQIYNATTAGARIEGAIPISLSSLTDLPDLMKSPFPESNERLSIESLLTGVKGLLQDLFSLQETLEKAIDYLASLLDSDMPPKGLEKINKQLEVFDHNLKQNAFALEVVGASTQHIIQNPEFESGSGLENTLVLYRGLHQSAISHRNWLQRTLERFQDSGKSQ